MVLRGQRVETRTVRGECLGDARAARSDHHVHAIAEPRYKYLSEDLGRLPAVVDVRVCGRGGRAGQRIVRNDAGRQAALLGVFEDDTGVETNRKRAMDCSRISSPYHRRVEADGKRVLLVHGSQRKMNEYLFEDRPLSSFQRLAASSNADIIVFGHTHRPYTKLA